MTASPHSTYQSQVAGLVLTENEKRLRGLLISVAESIDTTHELPERVVLRWAGGWVRDRLLQRRSHDIDVAINNMTGEDFAKQLQVYCTKELEKPLEARAQRMTEQEIGRLFHVAKNPEKSKHLATAGFRMFDLDLDFVNLRKETYADDSRNPEMEFGSAEEDALRRDATINALFYNIQTDSIEDFTGGQPDLQHGIIRTPLEPLQTFRDDPLRVLRLVRFASRLGFAIDPKTEKQMPEASVMEALRIKISRERVGVELEKMLKDQDPHMALSLIDRIGLYHAIFTWPGLHDCPKPEILRWEAAYGCLNYVLLNRTPGSIGDELVRTEEARFFSWYLAAMAPWMRVPEPPSEARKTNTPPVVATVAREGFKSPNKLTSIITPSHRHLDEIIGLKRDVNNKRPYTLDRGTVGMTVRKWDAGSGFWRLQILNAMLVEVMEYLPSWKASSLNQREEFLGGWQTFLDHLSELEIKAAVEQKSLLNGQQLAAALGVKPGKWMGPALMVCMEWQLRNPSVTDTAGAIELIRSKRDLLGIPTS